MLLVLLTTLLGLYAYAPDIIARRAIGLGLRIKPTPPAPKAEEIFRAISSSLPLVAIAYAWALGSGAVWGPQTVSDVRSVFSSLYSEKYFLEHHGFAEAFFRFLQVNVAILWRLYLLTGLLGYAAALIVRKRLNFSSSHPLLWRRLGKLIFWAVPPASEWHLILAAGHNKGFRTDLLVYMRSGAEVRGTVQGITTSATGELVSITLGEVTHRTSPLLPSAQRGPLASAWHPIGGVYSIVLASDIARMDVRYGNDTHAALELIELKEILSALQRMPEKKVANELRLKKTSMMDVEGHDTYSHRPVE